MAHICKDCRAHAFDGYVGEVRSVKVDRQGYTKRGEYYGTGAPIFQAILEHPEKDTLYHEARASNRSAFRAAVATKYPGAKVGR